MIEPYDAWCLPDSVGLLAGRLAIGVVVNKREKSLPVSSFETVDPVLIRPDHPFAHQCRSPLAEWRVLDGIFSFPECIVDSPSRSHTESRGGACNSGRWAQIPFAMYDGTFVDSGRQTSTVNDLIFNS